MQTRKNNIDFISPIDGDMLHGWDGPVTDKGLRITVKVGAMAGAVLSINGVHAEVEGGIYTAKVELAAYKNYLEAVDELTGERNGIFVYWLKDFAGHYRLSIDDNIWFLRDIHQNDYVSLFDHPYLAMLRRLQETYGTKVHLNLFYQTEGFTLSDMSDKYKDEWKANADWLRLSFHALQEFPDMPYRESGYEEVRRDCELVKREILRFAGEEPMAGMTTLHWGEATVEGARALRDAGYPALLGYFNVDDDRFAVSYYLDVEGRRHIKKRFIWRDNQEGIIFVRSSIVLDKTDLEQVVPVLDGYKERGGKPPYVDLLVHEQYFYPFYEVYQPDFEARLKTAVEWALENGYTSSFLSGLIYEP